MSKHKLDGMFREGLSGHKVAPRSEAWTKLKENLDSDRKKGLPIYWRVAAVMALFLTSVLLIYKMTGPDRQVIITDKLERIIPPVANKTNVDQLAEDNQTANQHDTPGEQVHNQETIAADIKMQTRTQPPVIGKTNRPEKQQQESLIDNTPKNKSVPAFSQTLATTGESEFTERKDAALSETVEPVKPRKSPYEEVANQPLTVVLEKQPINHKIADKPDLPIVSITFKKDANTVPDESIEDNKEVSKLKRFALIKVINLAKDIKEGEVGISTLRQKKDELLAFNFNKKKNLKNSK